MTQFPIHDVESAPEGSKPILAKLASQIGFIPNLAASMAESPVVLDSFTSLRRIAGTSSLDPVEREVVALAVSYGNRCTYCMAAHSAFAARQGASDALLEALRSDRPVDDRRHEALRSLARAVVTERGPLPEEAKQAFLAAGFTRAQMLEVLSVVAMTTLANHVHHVTEVPVDAAFAQQEWAVPA